MLFCIFFAQIMRILSSVHFAAVLASERENLFLPTEEKLNFVREGTSGSRREAVWIDERKYSISYSRINNLTATSEKEDCVENYTGFNPDTFERGINAQTVFKNIGYVSCSKPSANIAIDSEVRPKISGCKDEDKTWIQLDCVKGAIKLTRFGRKPKIIGSAWKSGGWLANKAKNILGLKENSETFQDRIKCEPISMGNQRAECAQMFVQFKRIQKALDDVFKTGKGEAMPDSVGKAVVPVSPKEVENPDSPGPEPIGRADVPVPPKKVGENDITPVVESTDKSTAAELASAPAATKPEAETPPKSDEQTMDTTTILLIVGGVLVFLGAMVGLIKAMGTGEKVKKTALSSMDNEEVNNEETTPLKHHRKKSKV